MNSQRLEKTKILGLNVDYDKVNLYAMYSLAILVPLVIGKPQLLVGTFINFLIVYSTLTYGIKKTIPILLLPSIVATSKGMLFGNATFFLLYLMPFIMISNFILSFFVSKKKLGYKVSGIVLKAFFLYVAYTLLNQYFGLPSVLLASVPMQFVTAALGFTLGYWVYHFSTKE